MSDHVLTKTHSKGVIISLASDRGNSLFPHIFHFFFFFFAELCAETYMFARLRSRIIIFLPITTGSKTVVDGSDKLPGDKYILILISFKRVFRKAYSNNILFGIRVVCVFFFFLNEESQFNIISYIWARVLFAATWIYIPIIVSGERLHMEYLHAHFTSFAVSRGVGNKVPSSFLS